MEMIKEKNGGYALPQREEMYTIRKEKMKKAKIQLHRIAVVMNFFFIRMGERKVQVKNKSMIKYRVIE